MDVQEADINTHDIEAVELIQKDNDLNDKSKLLMIQLMLSSTNFICSDEFSAYNFLVKIKYIVYDLVFITYC